MVAKVIAYGDTRIQAIRRMRIALSEMGISGIRPTSRCIGADATPASSMAAPASITSSKSWPRRGEVKD